MIIKYFNRVDSVFTEKIFKREKPLVSVFVGEFGHELFCYQGRMRWLSQFFPKTIIYTRKGHGFLYKDFAETRTIEATGDTAGVHCRKYQDLGLDKENLIPPQSEIAHYHPNRPELWKKIEQRFIKYGGDGIKFDYILHARNTNKWGTGYKDWGYDNWKKLISKLDGTIAMVGKKDSSLWIDRTMDLTDIPLVNLAEILGSAKMFIGSCSGVSHFATLCGTKKLIWGEKINQQRHEKYWNPFNTEVTYLPKGYKPTVEEVYEKSNL
jgi:hypothetical protein